ncbi:MAG: hypothetical protein HPY45_03205 [Anaerolineae bacterium]|nr:hypothetical protein [Anaerolineae bacterium]
MRKFFIALTVLLVLLVAMPALPASAEDTPPVGSVSGLTVFTTYPDQVIGLGETVNIPLKVRLESGAATVKLEMKQLPEGWDASFKGAGRIVQSVYAEAGTDASVDLRLEPPTQVAAETYRFVVVASSNGITAELPITLTVKAKTPPRLTFDTELPVLKGTPTTTFRYDVTLKNEGDEDLSVNILAEAPNFFLIKVKLSGQEITNLPVNANESKRLSIEAQPLGDIPAGTYPIKINAQGGSADASLDLTAEVTGQPQLSITAPDGRLSGQAYAGRETPLKILLVNKGTATARAIQLSASGTTGWNIEFEPKTVEELPANQQIEVTAKVRPSDKAVAGDYMLTLRAQPAEGPSQSTDFRITVLTSTLWGVVGIVLIAIAVGVVALAVFRFGRR